MEFPSAFYLDEPLLFFPYTLFILTISSSLWPPTLLVVLSNATKLFLSYFLSSLYLITSPKGSALWQNSEH